jgi:hypothetical protein
VAIALSLAPTLGAGLAASAPDGPTVSSAGPDPANGHPVPGAPLDAWRTLHFRGRNWLARFSAELEMALPDRGEPPLFEGDSDWGTELRTSLDSRLLADKSSRLRARFDPMTGVVRRLTQLSMGPRPDFKRYEFAQRGVTRVRSEPYPGQSLESPESWTRGPESFHAYDSAALGCRLVSNPAALAWWLTWGPGAAKVRSEDPQACYFLGKTLYRVDLESLGTSTQRVDYQLIRDGRSRRRSGRVRIERFEVVSHPIAGKLDERTIVAEISLDAENRLPWRFVMREGPLRIDVELERAILREPSLVLRGSPEPD